MKREEFEIMAPVGSWESLASAVNAGADSIYFGIENLNMRSKSSNNFTTSDLEKIVQICNDKKIKSYLTINTIIYDEDLNLLNDILLIAKKSNVTAIIASDLAVIQLANSLNLKVHLSTQLNISNIEAVKFFSQYSEVVVLARELNLKQVKKIYAKIEDENICSKEGKKIKIEMFCHGALCMAISGKCYLSLHEKNISANRGSCNQICRRGYNVKDKESEIELDIDNEYIMSPKDLKTINFIDEMIESGVRIFKIEGRARSAEYVKTVVECYNEAINAVISNSFTEEKKEEWNVRLSKVFNRGFWNGYYLGQRLGEWSSNYGSGATHKKIYVGKVTNYFKNINVGEFLLEAQDLKIGDEIVVIGETTGVYEDKITELRVDLKSVSSVTKGTYFSIKTNEIVRRNDKLYKVVEVVNT